jgi:mono/diheme cytochrome c family protein
MNSTSFFCHILRVLRALRGSNSFFTAKYAKNTKKRRIGFGIPAILSCFVVMSGCKEDNMSRQPRYRAYEPSEFFADGASAQPVPAGTVPRESPDAPEATLDPSIPISSVQAVGYGAVPVDAAAADNADSATIPFPITRAVVDRGQQRFDIYCAVCHGRLGNGEGMVVQRGFIPPPSFHIDRLRNATDNHFYDVISNGYGAMFSYAERVAPEDRWMIVAYIRVLQTAGESRALSASTKAELYGSGEGVHIETNPAQMQPGLGAEGSK